MLSIEPDGIIFIPARTSLADSHLADAEPLVGSAVQEPYNGDYTATKPAPPKLDPGGSG